MKRKMETLSTLNISISNVPSEDLDKLLWAGQALRNEFQVKYPNSKVYFNFNSSEGEAEELNPEVER